MLFGRRRHCRGRGRLLRTKMPSWIGYIERKFRSLCVRGRHPAANIAKVWVKHTRISGRASCGGRTRRGC